MRIEHIALWTNKLEELKNFYITYFGGTANEMYYNPKTGFRSYFITFDSGARLEIMMKAGLIKSEYADKGLAHFALSLGNKEKVDALTKELQDKGVTVVSNPRMTGDGYYESVVADPDGNYIELTA